MKKLMIIFLAALPGCFLFPAPQPVNPGAPVAVDGKPSDCPNWCDHLNAVGCAEGHLSNCVETCQHVISTNFTGLHVSCVMAAVNQDSVRACDPDRKLCSH